MLILYALTVILLAVSLIASRQKTKQALCTSLKKFLKITPPFLGMIISVALFLYFIPEEVMMRVLAHENRWITGASALGLGSISIIPGFIVFPLCGILSDRGALYMVLSAFSSTLMMVGLVTFPLEKAYLGTRLAIARNILSFVIAAIVAITTGLFFGELR